MIDRSHHGKKKEEKRRIQEMWGTTSYMKSAQIQHMKGVPPALPEPDNDYKYLSIESWIMNNK